MTPIRVLIVDDEPIARGILEGYAALLPQLHVAASCGNALDALAVLAAGGVGLILLDIDLPQISGLSLLRSLPAPPKVIFTTAYAQHAAESYDLNAVDYLLKPIPFDRFLKAINKVALHGNGRPDAPAAALESPTNLLFVKSEGKLLRIDLAEVQVIEGLRDYVVFHMGAQKRTIHGTMKALENRLKSAPDFLRIHKSYIVNLRAVTQVDGTGMLAGGRMLPIGSTYRDAVLAALEQLKLM